MLKLQIVSLVHISDKLVWNNKKQTSVISQLFNRLKNPSEGIKTLKIASMLAEFRLAAWRGLNVWLLVNNKFCLSFPRPRLAKENTIGRGFVFA